MQNPMTPKDVMAARHELGLSLSELAYLLGYEGNQAKDEMHRLEVPTHYKKHRKIKPCQQRLLEAYLGGYRPEDWPFKSGICKGCSFPFDLKELASGDGYCFECRI